MSPKNQNINRKIFKSDLIKFKIQYKLQTLKNINQCLFNIFYKYYVKSTWKTLQKRFWSIRIKKNIFFSWTIYYFIFCI